MRWILALLLALLVASQLGNPFNAHASPMSSCSRWIIGVMPLAEDCLLATAGPNCQPPEGWEPVSAITYGKDNKTGVLLRQCVE
jgi:hypothetical protein